MNKRFGNYQEELIEALKNSREAQAYLNEALTDKDTAIFLLALKNFCKAQEMSMVDLSKRAHLNRESLYKTLSKKGNPKLSSILSILNVLGIAGCQA